jgi:hypothetical protein
MRVAELRLEASARKVAGSGYLLVPLGQVSQPSPAVSTAPAVRNAAPVWMAAAGGAAASDLDVGGEALEQAEARTSFMANAKVFAVSQDLVKQLFELADSA